MRACLPVSIAALAILGGCATVAREPLVYVVLAGSGPCTVDLNEKRFTLPAEAEPLGRALTRVAKNAEGALIDSGEEPLSFACYREGMALVRKAGFARLGLITAAPPDPAKAEQPRPEEQDQPAGERPS